MNLDGLKAYAQGGVKLASDVGSTTASTVRRVVSYVSTNLSYAIKKIYEVAKYYINKIPYYCQLAVDYSKLGFASSVKYLRENKNPVLVGLGIAGVAATLLYGISKFFQKPSEASL